MSFARPDSAGSRSRVGRTAKFVIVLLLCVSGPIALFCLFMVNYFRPPSKMEDDLACLSVETRGDLSSLEISSRQKLSFSLEPWESVCSSFVVDQYDQPATRIALRRTTYIELMKMTKDCRNRPYEGPADDISEILGFLTRNRCPAYTAATGLNPTQSTYSTMLLSGISQRTVAGNNTTQNGKPALKMIYVGRDQNKIVCLTIESVHMNSAQKKSAANSCFMASKIL